ncbi:hypothetical protein Q3G72_005052 [Acer saccharum]|nr:hypothetical protein Q3G72_005052 [Acer saccharum]
MEIFKYLMLSFLSIATLIVMVHADSHSGFISIDCGLPENSSYTDKKTGIDYTSDATFTETGVSYNISSEYNSHTLEQQFLNVRSFPDGTRNCYTLKPAPGDSKFLIRASFMYGNYDGQNKIPSFDLLLGTDVWDSVELADASIIIFKEIIHVSPRNYIDVCLVNDGSGTPFMSSLELRPLENSRFKDDDYDRIWSPYSRTNWVTISSSLKVNNDDIMNRPPSMVMQTAAMPANDEGSSTADILSWGGRLRIATETAQGPEIFV